MSKFTFNDTVKIIQSAPADYRPGELASVVMVYPEDEREGEYFQQFPEGVVYMIEFEGGDAICIHESLLEKGAFPGEHNSGRGSGSS